MVRKNKPTVQKLVILTLYFVRPICTMFRSKSTVSLQNAEREKIALTANLIFHIRSLSIGYKEMVNILRRGGTRE